MDKEIIKTELTYKAVRSSGAGGQHVNKVSSKVMVTFVLTESNGLTTREKELLVKNLGSRLSTGGELQLSADDSRSQFRNKALVTERLFNLITENLIRPKIRKATKPSRAAKLRKLKNKKAQSEKKARRKKPGLD